VLELVLVQVLGQAQVLVLGQAQGLVRGLGRHIRQLSNHSSVPLS
jgi:hypothetical protein